MVSSRSIEREKLEGSPLAVCLDCKEMVLQVNIIWFIFDTVVGDYINTMTTTFYLSFDC